MPSLMRPAAANPLSIELAVAPRCSDTVAFDAADTGIQVFVGRKRKMIGSCLLEIVALLEQPASLAPSGVPASAETRQR